MVVVHLTSSTFYGGPERQMLGLAEALAGYHQTAFLSFAEGGRCESFLDEARRRGFEAQGLDYDTPRLGRAVRELTGRLCDLGAGVLCCHGYKASLLGRPAARRAGIPALAVSRGWTGESAKVRLYEALDRLHLRLMDRVVCVSEGQAAKVRRAGVPDGRVVVIPNSVDATRYDTPDPAARNELLNMFPGPVGRIVGAAGRLSPEKGFDVLVATAELVACSDPSVGFVLFGEGVLRDDLARRVVAAGLEGRFVLAGFRPDMDRFVPHLDVLAQSSFTEGMPNVVLEACAAGIPVVATAVGGTPEIVEDGRSGYLVSPGAPPALAERILEILGSDERRRALGAYGRRRIRAKFAFAKQAERYRDLFSELAGRHPEPHPTSERGPDSSGVRIAPIRRRSPNPLPSASYPHHRLPTHATPVESQSEPERGPER